MREILYNKFDGKHKRSYGKSISFDCSDLSCKGNLNFEFGTQWPLCLHTFIALRRCMGQFISDSPGHSKQTKPF